MRYCLTLAFLAFNVFCLFSQTIGFTQKTIASGLSLLRDVKTADMDGDGDLDILVTRGGAVDWFKNLDSKGTFSSTPVTVGVIFNANVAVAADIDGNGTMDVVVGAGSTSSNSEVAIFKNLDTLGTTFSAKITLTTLGDEIRDVIAADFDGDNDLDIVYASYDTDQLMFLRNTDGQGTFSAPVVYSAGNGVRFLAVADVDSDNDPDIFASAYFPLSSGQFSLYRNSDGQGAFVYSAINNLDGNNASDIAVADLDGDSDVDLVGTMLSSDRIYWYKNLDGAGMFSGRIAVSADFNGPYTVNIADIEGDGDNDLIVASEVDNKLGYLLNDGQGVFGTAITIPSVLNFLNASFNASRLIASADIDKDGDMDIIAISPGNNQLVWFKNAPPLSYSQQVTLPLCHGDATGAIYLSVSGGEPPYTISWADSTLQGDTLIGLPAGLYTVTIAESGGSQVVNTIEITQPDSLLLQLQASGTPSNLSLGIAVASAEGGTSPYQFLWNTAAASDSITGLEPGTYTCTITDAKGCTAVSSVVVNALPPLGVSTFVVHISCFGISDGLIALQISGGIPPYTISWDIPGLSGADIDNLPAGIYAYTVSDSTGFQITGTLELTQPPLLEISLSATPVTLGSNNGTATADVSGGSPPYGYNWSNGALENMIDSLESGIYAVTVADSKGCTVTDSVMVNITDGIEDMLFKNGLRFFPNPASDRVFFEMKSGTPAIDWIEISDLNGRTLLRQSGAGLVQRGFIQLPESSHSILVISVQFNRGAILRQKLIRLGNAR